MTGMPAAQLTVPTKADYAELVLKRVADGEDYETAVTNVVNYLGENPSTLARWWRVIGERATKDIVRPYRVAHAIRQDMPNNWNNDQAAWNAEVKSGARDWRDIKALTQRAGMKPLGEWTDIDCWTKANIKGRTAKTIAKQAAGWKRIAGQVPKGGTLGDVDLNPVDVRFVIGEAG
jgi:hypothetical protein